MPHPLLLDMGIHTFDAARFLTGADAHSVYCTAFNPPWSWYSGEACATAVFELTSGAIFTYRGSRCSDGWHTTWDAEWRAVGPQGTAIWDGRGAPVAEIVVEPTEPIAAVLRVQGAPDSAMPAGIAGTLGAFLHALETGTTPPCECHDNIKSLAMVHAAIESAATGRRMDIALKESASARRRWRYRPRSSVGVRVWRAPVGPQLAPRACRSSTGTPSRNSFQLASTNRLQLGGCGRRIVLRLAGAPQPTGNERHRVAVPRLPPAAEATEGGAASARAARPRRGWRSTDGRESAPVEIVCTPPACARRRVRCREAVAVGTSRPDRPGARVMPRASGVRAGRKPSGGLSYVWVVRTCASSATSAPLGACGRSRLMETRQTTTCCGTPLRGQQPRRLTTVTAAAIGTA
jgi:hypothetical protein